MRDDLMVGREHRYRASDVKGIVCRRYRRDVVVLPSARQIGHGWFTRKARIGGGPMSIFFALGRCIY
jgi:hypothetical protein